MKPTRAAQALFLIAMSANAAYTGYQVVREGSDKPHPVQYAFAAWFLLIVLILSTQTM